jgi:hypothetical protein
VADVSWLFRPGASAGVQSNQVFTNRRSELEAFQSILRAFRNSAAFGAPENLDHPRENVLNFFGMGGIGKTTLSKELYEKIDRQQVAVEKLLQRSVFLLPNVLFVVTGRNRLTWWDSRRAGELDYVGERIWPHLVSHTQTNTRCRLIGDLSIHDAQQYLAERVTAGAEAAIPLDVRERILDAAHGLPLYMEQPGSKARRYRSCGRHAIMMEYLRVSYHREAKLHGSSDDW